MSEERKCRDPFCDFIGGVLFGMALHLLSKGQPAGAALLFLLSFINVFISHKRANT